jgi:23S rRNA pseudouridine2605 synthase
MAPPRKQTPGNRKPFSGRTGNRKSNLSEPASTAGFRLNRYIARAGVCSRRQADELIREGHIRVNDQVVTDMGYRVQKGDKVLYKGRTLSGERLVYVLLNKPKDFITTTNDPRDRKTVMQLVEKACDERIYPVGRLDRNTTGLLLLTNDGALSAKLTHPSRNIEKVYQAELDKPLQMADLDAIRQGVQLEDGLAEVDDIQVLPGMGHDVGIELHSGKNRIVRRIFEHLGYDVVRLDRVLFAGITKKDLPRGKWRFLTQKEIIRLKNFT